MRQLNRQILVVNLTTLLCNNTHFITTIKCIHHTAQWMS